MPKNKKIPIEHDDIPENLEFKGHDELPIDDEPLVTSDEANELVESLRNELAELDGRYKRALADFQNFQRRARQSEIEARRQGATNVLQSIVPVLDHFDRALEQAPDDAAVAPLVEGVAAIRDALLDALTRHDVALIRPDVNDEFDPTHHEALMQQPAEGIEPGRIADVLQVGYLLGTRVIRPAKVIIAAAPPAGNDG